MSTLPSIDIRENAERNLSIAISRLEEMRWAVAGVNAPAAECLDKFDEGLSKLKDALTVIQASSPKL